jgi:formate hydrogenlyase subunit 6/NADH:ubiquinone oxidoreductase subunit I
MRGTPQFNHKTCTGCGACSNVCPTRAIEIIDNYQSNKRKIRLWLGACIFCGNCRDFCPEHAIELTDKPVAPSPSKWIFEELETELAVCEKCDKLFSPSPLYEKVNELMLRDYQQRETFKKICERCKRLYYAKIYTKTLS